LDVWETEADQMATTNLVISVSQTSKTSVSGG